MTLRDQLAADAQNAIFEAFGVTETVQWWGEGAAPGRNIEAHVDPLSDERDDESQTVSTSVFVAILEDATDVFGVSAIVPGHRLAQADGTVLRVSEIISEPPLGIWELICNVVAGD